MKKFGEKFPTYEPLGINHLAILDSKKHYEEMSRFGVVATRDQLSEITPSQQYTLMAVSQRPKARARKPKIKPATLRVLRVTDASDELEAELKKAIIEVAPMSNVYQISPDQPDLSSFIKGTLAYYDYYVVELGLNIVVGREAKITALLFEVDLRSEDARDRTDVTAFDVMPNDNIKYVTVIKGKISVGVSKLLALVPGPVGKVLPNLLSIDINPWEFSWVFPRYQIDSSGPKNYHIYWRLYDTEVVQGFNPTMILKVRKDVKKVAAGVRELYQMKTGPLSPKEIRSDEKTVSILPP